MSAVMDLEAVPRRWDWPEYFDSVLPRERELTWRDLLALDYREYWQYELFDGMLTCSPQHQAVEGITWRDVSQPEGSRWVFEMIDGMLIVTSNAPGRRHQDCVLSLAILLKESAEKDQHVVVAPFEYVSEAPFSLLPDVLVARRPIGEKRLEHTPELVIEVLSRGTYMKDMGLKRYTYERVGVPHFWAVDPAVPSVEAWTLVGGAYTRVAEVGPGETFVAEFPRGLSFDPAELTAG